MTTITDPLAKITRAVLPCRSCGKLVYFGFSENGKRTPYEVDLDGNPTRINHFKTCPDPKRWTKRSTKR